MFFAKYYSPFFLYLVFVISNCTQNNQLIQIKPEENEFVIFKDDDSLIQLELEKNFEFQKSIQENEKYYIFRWYKELKEKESEKEKPSKKELLYKLEIRIFTKNSNFFGDVLQPNYEAGFLKFCKCSILQKSWLFLKGTNAREYQYQMENRSYVSLHFNEKDFLIQIEGSSEKYDLLLNFWNRTIKTIK
ncbi:MAG: hypothetical protein ACK4UJ_09850 [Leptonema sp. (in: bacteria)]